MGRILPSDGVGIEPREDGEGDDEDDDEGGDADDEPQDDDEEGGGGRGGVSGRGGGSAGTGGSAGGDVSPDGPDASAVAGTGGATRLDGGADAGGGTPAAARDPLKWPFAQRSIWNMPIGSAAVFVPAQIQKAAEGMTVDPDLIVLTPDAPSTRIYLNTAGWSGRDRCPMEGNELFAAPMPASFVIPSGPGTPNHGIAILMPDRRTIKQTQPFSRCVAGSYATSQYVFPDVDLYGDGIRGAHGGSGMSAIGGTLRVGELRPNQPAPRHVLKGNVFCRLNMAPCATRAGCYRWPAVQADGYAADTTSNLRYGSGREGIPSAMKMGALLALASNVDIATLGLETEPARLIAWTLQNYGMYIVDDPAWDVYAFATENGPAGDFEAQFQRDWGFAFRQRNTHAWGRDMDRLFTRLSVVDNNAANAIGGGGTPRQPLAPDFQTMGDPNARTWRILPIGDSITESAQGYRGPLQRLLTSAGYKVDFVGTRSQAPAGGGDPDHEGRGGHSIGPDMSAYCMWDATMNRHVCQTYRFNIYDNLNETLSREADVALVLLGANDMYPASMPATGQNGVYRPVDPNQAATKLEGLVNEIRRRKPMLKVVVASLLRLRSSEGPGTWMQLNERARQLGEANAADNVFFADLHAVTFTSSDFVDDIHPSASGGEKTAQGWMPTLRAVLGPP